MGTAQSNTRLPKTARWLALISVMIIGCVALVARLRNGHITRPIVSEYVPSVPIQSPPESQIIQPAAVKPITPKPLSPFMRDVMLVRRAIQATLNLSWVRWLLFALTTASLTWMLLNLQPPYSTLLLGGIIAVIVGSLTLPPAWRAYRASLLWLRSSFLARWVDTHRIALAFIFTVSAVTFMIASALAFRPIEPRPLIAEATAMLFLGGLMLGGAVRLSAPLLVALPVPSAQVAKLPRLKLSYKIIAGAGVLTLWLVAEINGGILNFESLYLTSSNVQFWLLFFGVALVIVGFGGIPLRLPNIDRTTLLSVGALTLLALGVRFWDLNDSLRIFVDELAFSDGIYNIRNNPYVPLLAPMESIAAFPNLFAYLMSQSVEVFGRTFVGLRGASAVLGALAIPAVYLLARTLFDKKTALIAALLLATFPPHIHFSRLGISEIAGPLFGTLALAFLARGILENRRGDYAAGGAMLGLTHYFHEGSRVFFTPLAVLWVLMLMIIWRPRVRPLNILIAVLTAVIVAAPIYYTLIGMGRSLAARMVDNNSALSSAYWREMFENNDFQRHIELHFLPAFYIYVHLVENTLFYRGSTALLLTSVIPAFLLGLFQSIWRWRKPGLLLVLIWVVASSLGNSLMVDSIGSPRYVMVFPALMLMAAVGIRYAAELFIPGKLTIQMLVVVGLAIVLAIIQVNYYFNEHLPLYNRQFRNNWPHPDGQDAALRSINFPPGTQVHIISDIPPDMFFTRGVLHYFTDDVDLDTLRSSAFTPAYLSKLPKNIDHAFYLDVKDPSILALLEAYYYLTPPQLSPYDLPIEKQFRLYYAPYIPESSESKFAEAAGSSTFRPDRSER
jgi:4-amino-4-deoxy-L-arabinose transferase-like glycosyltransferase